MTSDFQATELSAVQLPDKPGRLPGPFTWLSLAVWLGAILLLSGRGYFASTGGPPVYLLAAIIAPQIAFWICYVLVSRFRRFILGLDIGFLVAVQSWRVAGLVLVFLWAYGLLTGGFALPAGVGDIIIGVWAVFVTLRVVRKTKGWQRSVIYLSLIGLVDFAFALWAANFAGPTLFDPPPLDAALIAGIVTRLPLSVIPAFLVPAFSCAHFAALAQVTRK